MKMGMLGQGLSLIRFLSIPVRQEVRVVPRIYSSRAGRMLAAPSIGYPTCSMQTTTTIPDK